MAKAKANSGRRPKPTKAGLQGQARKARRQSSRRTRPEDLPDEELLELVQRQTFRYFWDGAHPVSGLARDRTESTAQPDPTDELIGIGGSGFGVMAIIVAVERGWVDARRGAGAPARHARRC